MPQPYSLLGAGIEEEQTPQQEVSLLPSGNLPMIAPPPMANPGLAAGSGMLAGLQGQVGNPYLHSQQSLFNQGQAQSMQMLGMVQQQQAQQAQQQMQMLRLQQQQADMKQRKEIADNQLTLAIGKEYIHHENPDVAAWAGKSITGILAKAGAPPADELIKAMATKSVDPDKLNKLIVFAQEYDDPSLLSMFKWATPQMLAQARNASPAALKAILGDKYKTPAEIQLEGIKIKTEQADLVFKQYPELKGKYGADAVLIHRRLNSGREYGEGTDTSRDQAIALAKSQMLDDELKVKTAEAAITEGIRSRLAAERDVQSEKRLGIQQENMLMRMEYKQQLDIEKAETLKKDKQKQDLTVAKTFLQQFKDSIPTIVKKGFAPTDEGVFAAGQAAVKRGDVMVPGVSKPNDEDWRAWLDLQGNMVGWARGVQGEIGARFKGAFEQSMNVITKPPTQKGLYRIYDQMKAQIDAIERGDAPVLTPSPLAPNLPEPPAGGRRVQ